VFVQEHFRSQPGDGDVAVLRLPRSVDLTTHDGHRQILSMVRSSCSTDAEKPWVSKLHRRIGGN
jgi:hypothetical protein